MTFRRPGSHPDELISASLTGDLTATERAELEKHLSICESCRATLAAFTVTGAALGATATWTNVSAAAPSPSA